MGSGPHRELFGQPEIEPGRRETGLEVLSSNVDTGLVPAGPGRRCEIVRKPLGGAAELSGSLAVLAALGIHSLAKKEVDSRLRDMDHSRQIVPGIVEGSNHEVITLGHDFGAALGRHDLADPLAVVRRDQILYPFPERRLLLGLRGAHRRNGDDREADPTVVTGRRPPWL